MANVQTARVYYFADKLVDLRKFIERLAYAQEIYVVTQLEARAMTRSLTERTITQRVNGTVKSDGF
jgi:hypothetical protein